MKHTLPIFGMHCASCEILLGKELKKISGLKVLSISHKKQLLEVETEDESLLEKMKASAEKLGYSMEKPSLQKKNTAEDYLHIGLLALLVFLLFKIGASMNISQYFPSVKENAGVAIALLFGLIASVSTCLALLGGVVLGLGSMMQNNTNSLLERARPHLFFHVGRVGGFFILGGILGLLGSSFEYSLSFTGYFTIALAIILFYMGLSILNIVPNITKLGFHLPKSWSKKIESLEGKNHPLAPMIIGVLTFFLPCGFTQSMQLAAVASQSFWQGAFIMSAFAIGTLPVLLSLGVGSSYAQKKDFSFLKKIVGIVVIFFALYSLNSGLVLSGSSFTFSVPKLPETVQKNSPITLENGVQTVKMNIDWVFSPDTFFIEKSVPVRWEINGINVSGCTNQIVIPSMGIQKEIQKGLNVVEFTPTQSGILPFSCWMGMVRGQFIVK